ncbi:MAG: aromatic ring-hydroxylating dioxygenase subunit alpha [Pseudomonadota bacterium]
MKSISCLSSVTHERILRDTADATGLPNDAYVSPDFFQLEREQLFAQTWVCIGNACAVPNHGDVKPVGFLGAPLLMLRNKENEVRVFHNVCSHRGNELVWEPCHTGALIRCPYHAWAYDLEGQLQATPHIGGTGVHEIASLDKSRHGLRAARSAVWMDLVFVNLSEDAPPFAEFIAPLQQRIDQFAKPEQFDELQPAASHGQLTIEFAGNWKLCVENNLESYHLPWVHPDLNAISKLEDHYHFYGGDLFAGQGSKEYDHLSENSAAFPAFDGWPEKVAEYPTLFPNVFLGLHCDHYWTRIVEPVSPQRTLDHLQLYYLGEAVAGDAFESAREERLRTWTKVFNEDIGVVEGMQRGRHSPAFSGGVFSPVMDVPSHHFAKWVAQQLT